MRGCVAKSGASLGLLHLVIALSLAQDIKFNHITTNDGLANGNVRAILQDYQGFFWIATEDGLQRYDGYSLVEYRHDPGDPKSIPGNFVLSLFEDSHKNLWVGSLEGGLCWFDRKANNFRCFKNDPSDPTSISYNLVRTISESSDGTLYIGLREGGFCYFKIPDNIPEKIVFTNLDVPNSQNKPGTSWVSDIIEDKDKSMLIGINGGGIFRFNPVTKEFSQILSDTVKRRIQDLTLDSKDRLWISTWGDGLYICDRESRRIVHHTGGPGAHQLGHNQIEMVMEDAEGNFWICTDNGLSFFHNSLDPFSDFHFVTYRHSDFEPSSLLGNSIKVFCIDNMNRLWIGSYYGGVSIYDRHALKFNPIRHKFWSPGSISYNNVFSFAEDRNGNLWVGTDGGGLNYLEGGVSNIMKDQFKTIDIELNGNPVTKVKCIEPDNEGNLWIATWGSGLFKYDMSTGKYQQYGREENPGDGLLVNEVMTLETDRLDNLWIGTFGGGLSYFDKKQNRFNHFAYTSADSRGHTKQSIKSIHTDTKGRVWVSWDVGGLNLYDSARQSFRSIENEILKSDITILSIHEDKAGILWLGTNSIGLIQYNPEDQTTRLYSEKSGIANSVIYAIQEDDKTGHLWLSTNKGLSEFDPLKESVTNYNRADGLQGNQYNPESAYICSDGTLLFGGINGMDAFIPGNIETSSHLPEIVFTNFWLNNIETNVNDTLSPLKENIILADHVDLKHNQNSFAVEFAMLEYSFSNRNQYAYFLEGLDTSWQHIGSERKATFTTLSPGTYTLRVKASNSDGLWSQAEKVLTINIHPAWWQTTLFKISLIALVSVTIVSLIRIRMNFLLKQKRKLKKKVKERTLELKQKNDELKEKIEEIKWQNELLHNQKIQILEKNNEIQAQNEELTAQNDQILLQRENLRIAEHKLTVINEQLEALVEKRTKKLEETIQKLDKTVIELDRFVYSASHDLSAPLKSVLGLVQLARMEKEIERTGEYYNHIEFSIQKLDRVIKSMVEFSRNYHLDVCTTSFNFHDLVNEVLRELRFWPEARKITLKNMSAKESVLKSDSQRIKVVLHNLISNSVKYADFTKPDSYIHIDFQKNGAGNTIIISDNGMGIEQERQSRIFEMYYRATDRSYGSGLGLFIVKEIILKLGGTVEVKSSFGSGSVFIVNIPEETSS